MCRRTSSESKVVSWWTTNASISSPATAASKASATSSGSSPPARSRPAGPPGRCRCSCAPSLHPGGPRGPRRGAATPFGYAAQRRAARSARAWRGAPAGARAAENGTPVGATTTGLSSRAATSGRSSASRASRASRSSQRRDVAGRAAAVAEQQRRGAHAAYEAGEVVVGERRDAVGPVAEQVGCHAAEPEGDDRAEQRVLHRGEPGGHAGRGHRLHDVAAGSLTVPAAIEAKALRSWSASSRSRRTPPSSRRWRRCAAVGLERHRVAERPGGRDGLVGRAGGRSPTDRCRSRRAAG